MTVLTAGACATVINTTGCAIPAAVGSALGITLTGLQVLVKGNAVGAALGAAVGTATSAGAITGAVVTKTLNSAIMGALVGGMSAGGSGSVLAGSLGGTAGGIMSSPFGMLCVGTSTSSDGYSTTYDCWKPVVHDMSETLSSGMLLRDLCRHPNVVDVVIHTESVLPYVVIENKWNEKFEIEYLLLNDTNALVCHATRISS